MTAHATAVLPVVGFVVKSFTAIAPKEKDEEDMGKLRVVLEVSKDDLRADGKDISDMISALNMHHSTREPVAVQLRF